MKLFFSQRHTAVRNQKVVIIVNLLPRKYAFKTYCLLNLLPSLQYHSHLTPLMSEDQYWGCFYIFPELYEDDYSPVVRVRRLDAVPELVGGVLTRDMIAACLSYLKRTPILGDFVFMKLDLSTMVKSH